MSSRREFLLRCFRLFAERSIAYCVLRNFDRVLDDSKSDVDLIVGSGDVEAVLAAGAEAAKMHGWRRVQSVRFVNHSVVYWDGQDGLVRIDIDTEVRWRFWPVLSADEVLAARIQRPEFCIASPEHEAVILRTQMVWMGRATERYSRRLAELGAPVEEVPAMRRAIMQRCLWRPSQWISAARYAARDLRRWLDRVRQRPGASMEISAPADFDIEGIFASLDTLFPRSKSCLLAPHEAVALTMFKGGLAIRRHAVPPRRISAAGHSFAVVARSPVHLHVAHGGSGGMMTVHDLPGMARFIFEALARELEPVAPGPRGGASASLAGLDGAGKTTFARELCAEVWRRRLFRGISYSHWIPALGETAEFPWPQEKEVPRKAPMAEGPVSMVLSFARLVKNVFLACLAWHFRVQPRLRRGDLILLDRFLYNYWLDPDSVRFAAPARCLAWVLPFLPKPDVLFVLVGDAKTLRARKQELTEEQIAEQTERLSRLPAVTDRRIDLDASQPPEVLAERALNELRGHRER